LENFGYNTAIAKLMELVNELEKRKVEWCSTDVEILLRLLAPFAPYISEELWREMGHQDSIHVQQWPMADKKYLVDEQITLVISINGKVRDQLVVSQEESTDKTKMLSMAKEAIKIKPWLDGKQVVKEIFVPGRMVNLVVS
jgi:leucyl-tRNA synthetase